MRLFAALLSFSLACPLGAASLSGEAPRVTGRIVNEAGKPVAGAEVVLSAPDSEESLRRSAVSSPAGRFELRSVTSGTVNLTVTHPDHADFHAPWVEIPAGQEVFDLGSVTLSAGGVLEGKVTGAGGKPIEGAEVRISPYTYTPGPDGPLDLKVRTGPDGTFRARGLRRGDRFEITAWHSGYVPTTLFEVPLPSKVPVRIGLTPVCRLSGQVAGSGDEPVAGAVVVWERNYRSPETLYLGEARGVTDTEGRFRLDGLPCSYLRLEVSADGHISRWVDDLQIPDGGALENVKVILQRAHVLAVRVLDTEGQSVKSALVRADSEDRSSFMFCETDSAGRCLLNVNVAQPYVVKAWGDRLSAVEQRPASATVRVSPGTGETPVELRLPVAGQPQRSAEPKPGPEEKGVVLTGRILGVSPADLPRTLVQAVDPKGLRRFGRVDLKGVYRIGGATPGWWWTVLVLAPGAHGYVTGDVWADPDQMEVTLDLEIPRYKILSGRVLLDGKPLAGAQIFVSEGYASAPKIRTAYDGTFRARVHEAGPVTLEILDHPLSKGVVRTLRFKEGREVVIKLSSKPD
jgi:hypothetical protein